MNIEIEQNKEKTASISVDRFFEFVALLNVYEGVMIIDEHHIFYLWITKEFPQFQDIDGVSLLQLYERNVIEGDMSKERFHQYCLDHNFPTPMIEDISEIPGHPYLPSFYLFIENMKKVKKKEYEDWAQANGILTEPGSIMRFIDAEGYIYRICTDFENHGQIIVG